MPYTLDSDSGFGFYRDVDDEAHRVQRRVANRQSRLWSVFGARRLKCVVVWTRCLELKIQGFGSGFRIQGCIQSVQALGI